MMLSPANIGTPSESQNQSPRAIKGLEKFILPFKADQFPKDQRRRGNATSLKQRPEENTYVSVTDPAALLTLNPKISYSELRKCFKSPSPPQSTNNASFKKMAPRSFLSPTPSLKDLKDHIGAFQTVKKEIN